MIGYVYNGYYLERGHRTCHSPKPMTSVKLPHIVRLSHATFVYLADWNGSEYKYCQDCISPSLCAQRRSYITNPTVVTWQPPIGQDE